jgi:hypothetical protein
MIVMLNLGMPTLGAPHAEPDPLFESGLLFEKTKKLHENAIKYLTYLVLNKRKLDNKQTPVPPP